MTVATRPSKPVSPSVVAASRGPATGAVDPSTLGVVRTEVRDLLGASAAFRALPAEQRRAIASDMVKVASYMANPDGLAKRAIEGEFDDQLGAPLASPLADNNPFGDSPADTAGKAASENRGFAGEDFKPGAVKAGVQQFGELVKKVDFPKFVSGLIKGVFQAIVESSIEQMRAYGELIANVSKSVDQFAQDNITENNARDWLTDQFPGELGVKSSGPMGGSMAEGGAAPTPQLEVRGEDRAAALLKISQMLNLSEPVTDISDPDSERKLVIAARLSMAKSRQQLLASMVMLGINRIVITNGLIHANVVFDMRAKDVASRNVTASMSDERNAETTLGAKYEYGAWYSPYSASIEAEHKNSHVATVQSSQTEGSESAAEVKANLTGEVRVNFKSDYMPMDKLATPEMIAAIQGNATPTNPPGVKPATTATPARNP